MQPVTLTGTILRTYPLGDHDRIIVILTLEAGILRAVAKGASKPGNRWGGRLEPLARNTFLLVRRSGGLGTLTGVETRASGARLRSHLERLLVASALAEATLALLPEEEPCEEVFACLDACLELLCEGLEPDLVGLWFALRLLDACGYRPGLQACVICGGTVAYGPTMAYLPAAGGVRCALCPYPAVAVPGRAISLLQGLQDAGLRDLLAFQVEPDIRSAAVKVLIQAIARNAQRDLPACEMWRSLAA